MKDTIDQNHIAIRIYLCLALLTAIFGTINFENHQLAAIAVVSFMIITLAFCIYLIIINKQVKWKSKKRSRKRSSKRHTSSPSPVSQGEEAISSVNGSAGKMDAKSGNAVPGLKAKHDINQQNQDHPIEEKK